MRTHSSTPTFSTLPNGYPSWYFSVNENAYYNPLIQDTPVLRRRPIRGQPGGPTVGFHRRGLVDLWRLRPAVRLRSALAVPDRDSTSTR